MSTYMEMTLQFTLTTILLRTYILTTAKLDATGHRWVAALAACNFILNYRPGKANIDVDALSRIPWDREQTVEPGNCRSFIGKCHYKSRMYNGVIHRAHDHSTRASTQVRTGENVCNRLDRSSKRGKGTKESN